MKMLVKKLLREALLGKKQYIGQCDTLRRTCDQNEAFWHEMMKNKQKISFKTFLKNVDFQKLLDDGETAESYIKDALRTDSETAAYVSNWGDKEAMFLQTAGFEFIFV